MTKSNILMATTATLLLASGCVKPVQEDTAETIYSNNPAASTPTASTQGAVYEEPQSSVYQPSSGTIYGETQQEVGTVMTTPTQTVYSEGGVYNGVQQDVGTVTTATTTQPTYGTNTYETNTYGTTTTTQPTYDTNTYGTATTNYPDPYANGNANVSSTPVYNDPYTTTSSQSTISNYPVTTPSTSSGATGGGIHLQVAALKDYYSAQEYKNRLSLAPGQSAYIKRGAMNKVIVTGISSVSEANRLKESRFPGAFIVQGGTSGGYTPPVQPNYSTSSYDSYSVNNPYGVSSSTSGGSGFGVQVGAFGSRGKADAVASNQSAQYPAKVKKIGRYYKVILTGFSSRSAAKAYAGRVGGFVVSY